MEIKLNKKINSPTIICGYNSSGLAGQLVLQQILEDDSFVHVGWNEIRKAPPIIAKKENVLLKPLSIFHNEKNNVMIISIISQIIGLEWEIADMLEELYKKTNAKMIICLDATLSDNSEKLYHVSNFEPDEKLKNISKTYENYVLSGLPSALLMKDISVISLLGNAGTGKKAQIKAANGMPMNQVALNLINGLNDFLNLDAKTERLEELGDEIDSNIEKYLNEMQKQGKTSSGNSTRYIG